MEILKAILSAAPSLIKAIADVVKARRERKAAEKAAAAIKRIELEEYHAACDAEQRKQNEAAKIRAAHKNEEYRP